MTYQLAQVNIARMLAPLDDPVMTDFVNNLDRINAVAERSEGFVWRLVDDANNATSLRIIDDEYLIVNMSVWESMDHLFSFTYQSDHLEIFKRKKEWFSRIAKAHLACWWVAENYKPTIRDAEQRLEYLDVHGETPLAFTFKKRFTVADFLNYQAKTPDLKT